ncbi:MAG TPA: hypothetical protein VLG46_06780 [Anaerolineae bacterium]|nr:hypothetical protein [Anaerolineae bacterium]
MAKWEYLQIHWEQISLGWDRANALMLSPAYKIDLKEIKTVFSP